MFEMYYDIFCCNVFVGTRIAMSWIYESSNSRCWWWEKAM